jgi:hypothetical protein
MWITGTCSFFRLLDGSCSRVLLKNRPRSGDSGAKSDLIFDVTLTARIEQRVSHQQREHQFFALHLQACVHQLRRSPVAYSAGREAPFQS